MDFGTLLLCKAKALKGGEWATGYFYEQPIMTCIGTGPEPTAYIITRDPNACADWNMPIPLRHVPVDSKTIGLSTGAHDKEGSLLFTGDIVQWGVFLGRIAIKLSPAGYWQPYFYWYKENKLVSEQPFSQVGYDFCTLRLVGNVWDNQDLLGMK